MKPFLYFGPSGETRTRGILLPKQARYQLRYTWILVYTIYKGGEAGALPVVVPGALLAEVSAASLTDHCHSLRSLHPPPAALPSLPNCATPG